MKTTNRSRISKNSLFPVIAGITLAIAALALFLPVKRQYSPPKPSLTSTGGTVDKEKDNDATGMMKFFFNIRKDNHTNTMNYRAMLAADVADRQMSLAHFKRHEATSTSLPSFTWNSLGPTNIGGRTRAILIDKNDPTHQTIFAGGVSGGIWKSTNGGSTWDNSSPMLSYSLNDTLSNINVSCIAQDSNGAIYIGTGEGFSLYSEGDMFSSAILGGGIFKSTDDGITWRLLASTTPAKTDNDGVAWAYTNRIAVQPTNFKVLYAATNYGLYVSHDSGATWGSAINSAHKPLTGNNIILYNSLDVKISRDGSVIVAFIGGNGYYCYPLSGPDSLFTEIASKGAGHLNGGASRIEFAISPTDPNRIYASVIEGNGNFGSSSGIFMTETAKTNGGYWYLIGPGGSLAFDPYAGQADYDNTLAVFPTDEGSILVGGTTIYQWQQLNSSDTIGEWTSITPYFGWEQTPPVSNSVHPDQHAMVFDLNNPSVAYFGCDGGVYKSTNITSYTQSTHSQTFAAFNRNYNVTQYYAVDYSPEVDPTNQESVGGGTQDNGSPYIPGTYFNPQDGIDLSSGDGGQGNISQINPNIAFATIDGGTWVGRTGNLGTLTFPSNFYNGTKGDSLGANIDSVSQIIIPNWGTTGCFVFPLALYENTYDLNNLDSMQWTADKKYAAGDTINALSDNGPSIFPYVLTKPVDSNVTITIPDRVVSKLAVAFTPSYGGFWVTAQAANLQAPSTVWIPFGGPRSKPDACSAGESVHCLAWSPDGDDLWGGTEDGYLYRFTNMNSIIGNKFMSGALWYEKPGTGDINTAGNKVVCTSISLPSAASGREIISIAVDPKNANNVLVTLGNYNNTEFVFYSGNALASTPIFVSKQGNLPDMPVYGSLLDIKNGNGTGTWATNSAMVATEHGIYTTNDITQNSPTWIKNSNGLANALTAAVRQQTREPWECNNSGDIYAGTHGRGIWYSGSTFVPTGIQPVANNHQLSAISLTIYPNPMSSQGTLEFTVKSAEKLTMAIYDIQGKEVTKQELGTQAEGRHLVPLQANDLNSGVYFISLTGENYKQAGKFIVQK